MVKVHSVILFAALVFSVPLMANEVGVKPLIKSCGEYVAIYDRRGQKNLFAGISTSVAEAMRAGVCHGILEEHARHYRSNYRYSNSMCETSLYDRALFVSDYNQDTANLAVEELLDKACDA